MAKRTRKSSTKKARYSYDPELEQGYAILRNLDSISDIGTAIQSHDRTRAGSIDSEYAEYWRQNAEELEWERKKQEDIAEASENIDHAIQSVGPWTPLALSGNSAQGMAKAYEHIKNRDLPNQPADYDVSDLLKDQWNSFFGEMNTLQAEDAKGYQVRSQNDKALIGDYLHSLDTLDDIDNIDGELEQINNALGQGGLSTEDRQSLRGRATSLIQQKNALLAEYESLAPSRKLLEDTVNQSGVGAAWDDLMSGNGIFGGNWANPAGKVTAAHDELNDARRFLYDLGKGTRNRKETRQMLNRALQEYDNLNEGWNAVIEENERDAKYHKDKISNWFQARADRTGINFTDPDTYLFKMPGIIGGSSSSYMKQVPAMLSSILGYAAANVATGGGALLATALGAAGSFAMNRAAGVSENNAEVALATKDKIKAKTNLTDEDIDKLVSGKLDDPKKLRAITENIRDVENLFNQDMAATTWDAAIDAALGAVPVGAIAKINRFVRGTKAWRKAVTNPTMKKILRSKFGEDVVKGWEAGSVASPLVGVGAAAANATIGRAVKNGAAGLKNLVVRGTDNTLYGALAHDMAKEISLLGKTSKALDLDKIATNQALKKGLGAQYMKDITGKVIKSAIAEGIEEGKQHANAEAYKNSYQNNPELNNTLDIALTDALNGLTMGSYVLGIPLDGLGIINIKDQDLLQEIKGGMLGGWGQTAMVNVAQNIVPYISQQKAADIITEQIFNNKLSSTAQRDQYRQWLSKGLFKPGHQDILDSFDRLRKINEEYQQTNGQVGIAPQQIDEAQQKYERIISLAKDPLMRQSAEDQGINVRTKNNPLTWKSNSQYHDYVATVATAMDRIQEITQNRNEAAVNLNQIKQQIQTNLSISNEGLSEVLNALQSNEELDNLTDRQNNIESVGNTVMTEGQSDFEYTDVVAQLAALLTYRDQIEQGLKLQQDNPSAKVRRGLKGQLDKLNKDIDELIKVNEDEFVHQLGISIGEDFKTGEELQLFKNAKQSLKTLADVEDHLAYNEEAHEQLKEAYLDLIKWNNELDSANQSFENLVGKREQDENGEMHYVGGNAVNIMKNIQQIKDADDAFEQSVEQVFQEDLKAQHLDEENAWREQEIQPRIKKPVLNSKGEQIQVQRSQDGYINRRLADNETVDDMGYLWRYEDGNPDDPLNRIDRGAITPAGNAEQDRRAFRDAWANITGTQLPLTPEGMIERRQRTLFEEARKNGWPEPASEPEKRTDYKSLVESYYERRNRLVPPSVPPTPPTPPIVHNDDPQQDVLDMLEAKYEDDKKVVQNNPDGYDTTSQDYFIENDGKIVRASRVHNVKPESYNHPDQNKQIEDIYNRFKEAKSLKDVEDIMIEYVDPDPDEFTEIHVYHLYIQDNQNAFFDNPTSDSIKEYQTTIKNLSQAIVNNQHKAGVSVKVGNVIDELLRNFFGSFEFADYTQTEEGIEKIFNDWTTESDGRTYKEIFKGNIEAFKSLIHDLQNQYDYYTKTLGWKLSTLPFTWKAKFNELGWVAGQTDMIGVDKEGKVHIIDFKTSKYTFWNAYPPNIQLTSTYQSDLGILTEDDFYTDSGRLSRKARNVLRAIKDDNKNAKIDLEWQNGRAVVVNKIRPFVSLPNAQYGQQLSSYEDYSNQLTAYAEMLKAEGFDVASIEILPIKVQYDYQFTEAGKGLNSATLEPRVFLTFSSKMLSILDGIESRDDQALQNVKEDLHNSIGHIDYKLSQLEEKITDDVFNELSEQGKLLYSDFVTRVNNIVAEVNQTLYNPDFKDDIDVYRSQLSEADKLLEEFDQFLRDLRADYSQARLKATQQAENEAKRDLQKKREQQAGPAVGTVQAPNKRDSQGNVSHTNLNYQRINGDRELALATIAPNFIDDADITLYIDGDDIYCDISFEGKTWQRVLIDSKYNNTWMPNGKKLYDTIKQLQSEAKPGEKIVPVKATMYRTNGRINLAVDKDGKLTYNDVRNTDLFAGQNIYDIEFSAAYGSLGFVDNNGQIVTFDTRETDRKPIGQWSNVKMASQQGTLIYKKRMPKNERSNSEVYVAIDRVKMSPNDADFIVEALKNPTQLDRAYFKEINGTSYNLHATPRQIINLMIPIVDDPQRLGNFDSIIRDPNNQNVVYIMKRQDLAANTTGRGRFDLAVDADVARFKAELQSMSIAERHDVLMSRLGSFNSTEGALPFGGIRQFFVEQNGAITSLDITDTIKFDLEDFRVVKSPSGVTRQGVNGFAYYLKHGMLRTQYANMGGANVEIKDAMIDRDQSVDVSANGVQSTPNMPEATPIGSVSTVIDTSSIDDLFKIADPSKKTKPISEEKARKHIAEILGEHVPVEFQPTFIKVASGAAHVVGNCKADAIVLSSYAWSGVEYHEAFHRVFELLLPSHERDAIYQKIAKRIGVELYQDGKENKQAFREVAEYAADHYMEHMQHHMTDLKIPFLTKIYNKIHDWVSMLWHWSDRDLYKTFIEVNDGKYKPAIPSKKAIERFNRLYNELYCQIHGIDFEHIVNRPMYDKLRQNVMFCILYGQNVDPSGRNIQEIGKHIDKETFLAGAERLKKGGIDIFGDTTDIPTVGQLAMKEIYDNFDNEVLRDDIANDISVLSTDFVKQIEEDSTEDAQSDDVTNASIGEHTRSSYEFSRFSKTSSRVRFFFATIPDTKYEKVKEIGQDGKPVVKQREVLALNELGLPQYAPVGVVFNEFLNFFHDIDTISELKARLEYLAKEDPLYSRLYKAIDKIDKSVYTVKDGVMTRNSDQEALLVQLMNIIRSNKHNFDIARSTSYNNGNGLQRINIQTTDADYNATFYPTQWNQMLVNGGTPVIKVSQDGSLRFNPAIKGVEFTFQKISELFSHGAQIKTAENGSSYTDVGIKEWLSNAVAGGEFNKYLKLKINGKSAYYNNPKNPEQLEVVKDKIVQALNMIGIQFSGDEFNYMLRHKYGSTDYEALSRMFSSTSFQDSMTSFLQFLRDAASNGKLNQEVYIRGKKVKIENAYSKLAFIRELANWKYAYRHAHDQLTVLATGNNKFYEISDNNYISDVTRYINKRSPEFEELKNDPYVFYEGEADVTGKKPVYGSLILKEITDNPDAFITLRNFVGFKTDKRGDYGSDYFEISKQEDYVSKATILEQGGIIMPTLSDKKTWVYVDGIKLPGLDYSGTVDDAGNTVAMAAETLGDQFIISADPISQLDEVLSQKEDVVDRFISYAMSEYQSVKKADRDLDEMEANGTKGEEVANYYNKEQGAMFSSLLGVWVSTYKNDANGQPIVSGEKFISFNNKENGRTRKDNIKDAEDYFFKQPRDIQRALISRLLHKRLLKEIDTCEKLGLIRRVENSNSVFGDYENVGLNNQAIDIIYKSIVLKNGQPKDGIATQRYKSLAVMIYLNDISNKSIMSGQEVERVFSGNPAFYKWIYDSDGNLIDRTVDELKRLGGLVSTGNNNFTELKDVPSKYLDENGNFKGTYVAAEVDNELIESPQLEDIEQQMTYGEISVATYLQEEEKAIKEYRDRRNALLQEYNKGSELDEEDRKFLENSNPKIDEQEIREEVSSKIDAMSIEDMKQILSPKALQIAERKAKEATDSYRLKYKNGKIDDGINVADGGAYITDTMAEMLLRMNGNYSTEIQNAFRILREEVTSNLMQKHQAYQQVVTSVIGSQKYTAFGRRLHKGTGIQVTYYNKMALFPLFKCIATGKMQNVFNKMKSQGIDMLMVNSAVKVGSQGSKPIEWNTYAQNQEEYSTKPSFDESFEFNTYEQKFLYLRKQLNTDPKEESMMSMGTQMTKVVMSCLFDGRDYVMQDGSTIKGSELRSDIMNAINTLSDRGYHNIVTRFFKTDSKGNVVDKDGNIVPDDSRYKILDEVKFAKEVKNMMQTKDPDRNVIDALEIVEQKNNDGTTSKHLRLPLNAISNSTWMESVLVSSINKKVVDIETPGAAFIQRSIWAMEGSTMYSKTSIQGDADLPQWINGGKRLQMINEEGSMDCVLSLDFFKKMFKGELPVVPIRDKNRNLIWDLIPETDKNGKLKLDENGKIVYKQKKDKDGNPVLDKDGKPVYKRKIRTREMSFDETRNWLMNRGIIGPNATANIIGYRIPTQAESSIHALRCVDILPVVNDTVILPAEFTKITGSDFD